MEPLKPGLPEYEKVLGEARQLVTIGSARGKVDICVHNDATSKRHAVLALVGIQNELALAVSDHSTNGTWVNDQRVPAKDKRFRIRTGDRLLVKDPGVEPDVGWKVDIGNAVAFFSRT